MTSIIDADASIWLEISAWFKGKPITAANHRFKVTMKPDYETQVVLHDPREPWGGFRVSIIWTAELANDWASAKVALLYIDGSVIGPWAPAFIYLGESAVPATIPLVCHWDKHEYQGIWLVAIRRVIAP